jgi:hypothetical protein
MNGMSCMYSGIIIFESLRFNYETYHGTREHERPQRKVSFAVRQLSTSELLFNNEVKPEELYSLYCVNTGNKTHLGFTI